MSLDKNTFMPAISLGRKRVIVIFAPRYVPLDGDVVAARCVKERRK